MAQRILLVVEHRNRVTAMSAFDRVFTVRHASEGWQVSDGEETLTTTASQRSAIKWAAMAAMTEQVKGYTATFRLLQ